MYIIMHTCMYICIHLHVITTLHVHVASSTKLSMATFLFLFVQAVKRRPDLKLIVTSATLDAVKFSSYFYEAVSQPYH